jgi:hypothetical protein
VHCDNKAIAPQPSPSTGGEAPSIFGSCGGGEIGNGICADNNECCSTYGFCGTSEEHCANKVGNFGPDFSAAQQTTPQYSTSQQTAPQNPASQQTIQQGTDPVTSQTESYPGATPFADQTATNPDVSQIKGTCGSGSVGNGICTNHAECCSTYGFCGTSLEHCTNKADPAEQQQPNTPQYSVPAEVQQQQQQQSIPQSAVSANSQQQQYTPQYAAPTDQQQYTQVPPVSTSQTTNAQVYPQTSLYQPVQPHGTNKKIIGY